ASVLEGPTSIAPTPTSVAAVRCLTLDAHLCHAWQRQHEPRSFAKHAFGRQIAVHRSGQVAADGETKANAVPVHTRQAPVDLDEGLEDALEALGRDADTGVEDLNSQPIRSRR